MKPRPLIYQRHEQPYARIRTRALIAGDRAVVQLRPPVSTAQTTVITPALAERIGARGRPGPVRCTSSAMGKYCGRTRSVAIVIGEIAAHCPGVDVRAIVVPIPGDIGDLIVGHDVLQAAKPELAFGRGHPMRVSCRRRRSR